MQRSWSEEGGQKGESKRREVSLEQREQWGLWAGRGRQRPEYSVLFYHLFYHLLRVNQHSLCFKHFISFIPLSPKQLLEVSAFIINFAPRETEAQRGKTACQSYSVMKLRFETRSL